MTSVNPDDRDAVMVELGQNLSRLMDEQQVSYKTLERALWRILPDDPPSHETIRTYHLGLGTVARAQLRVVAALCIVYEVPLTEVSPEFARRAEALRDVIDKALDPGSNTLTWPYTQLALYLDDWSSDRAGEQWKILASSTSTGPPNELEGCPSQPSAATESCTRRSRDGALVAA